MASLNPFDLLGDDDNDDPSHLIAAAQQQKVAVKSAAVAAAPQAPSKLPTKPVPPAQAVREARNNSGPQRGGFGAGGGRGRGGRGGRSFPNREYVNGEANGFSGRYGGGEDGESGKPSERGPRQLYRGGRRGGYANGEAGGDSERPPRRAFERRSGTGRGHEFKREGAGRGNWGTPTDDVIAQESVEVVNAKDNAPTSEKQLENEIPSSETENIGKEEATKENEEKEPEDKEMTLEEYEKIREEKRKGLLAMKTEERKVDTKEFESLQQLSLKKGNHEIFIKLGSDKDSRKQRENGERDEKVKKSVSISEFLKTAEGGWNYSGRGRGQSDRGSRGGFGGCGYSNYPSEVVIKIADPGQFPTLGGK